MFQYVLSRLFSPLCPKLAFYRRNQLIRPMQRNSQRRREKRRLRSEKLRKVSSKLKDRKWTKQRRVLSRHFVSQNLITHKVTDAVKRYAYLLGQTELFKHFVNIKVTLRYFNAAPRSNMFLQRARDPEYAAIMDAQPKPKGRGRKKFTYAIRISIIYLTNLCPL